MSEAGLLIALFAILLAFLVVLVERKFLAYAQRRMGPAIMGRNGAFQIVLDLVKLLVKDFFLIPKPTLSLMPFFIAFLYAVQLSFSQNFIFGYNMFLFENLDALILHHLILVLFSNIFTILIGLFSQSRYAVMASIRGLVHIISLDIFITVVYSLLIFSAQSANFHDFSLVQNFYWFLILYFPASSAFVIILLLEAKRTPFDHTETEAEVVAGFMTEYSGPMLMMLFLAEYLHVVISSIHFTICFLGGWVSINFFFFLPSIFLIPHSINFIFF